MARNAWREPLLASALALVLAAAGSAGAQASLPVAKAARARGAVVDGDPRVEAALLVHPDDLASDRSIRIGVLFDLDPGWHLYWRNPGETGLPTVLRWRVDGAEVGATAWPAPSVFTESDGLFTSYGYADQVLLASEAIVREPVSGPRVAHVEVDLLVCESECVPARLSLSRPLDGAEEEAEHTRARTRQLFQSYADRVPLQPEALGVRLAGALSQSAVRPGDRFRVAIAVSSCSDGFEPDCDALEPVDTGAAFFPDRIESIELELSGIRPHPTLAQAFLVGFEGTAGPDDPGHDQRLSGVLALRGSDGELRHVQVDLPLPRARSGAEVAILDDAWLDLVARSTDATSPTFPIALLLAFLGGLVLNLMPCVLPVLAIKVVALADLAHRDRREVLAHGLAYALGVLVTMSALALVVLLLRAAGTRVGWGFQFQEPLFLASISAVLVVFALNLFGVFEIQFHGGGLGRIGQRATGRRRSFFEGLLAVVLATPCTAPFLGTAVGFALASSDSSILAIFLAIGVGLASPFALISLAPAWAKWIPHSGTWMLELRAGLGFALLASVVWLLWIVGRALGTDALIALVGWLLAIAFAVWLYGIAQGAGRRGWKRAMGLGLVLLAGAGLGAMPRHSEGGLDSPRAAGTGAWLPFEPAAVAQELRAGRRVFVYFTADWCLTCKVNERRVITDESVRDQLDRMDVAVFRADWTRRDEAIRSELARFGRAGVPLYLVYHPSSPDRPRLLPELLTAEALLEALERAPDGIQARFEGR